MIISFSDLFKRIQIIDRDISELNRLKSRLPEDRPYASSLQLTFDKQINILLTERTGLLELEVKDPPVWLVSELETPESKYEISSPYKKEETGKVVPTEQDIIELFRLLPKTELHLHLEACVNKKTLKELLNKNKIPYTEEEFEKKFDFHDLNGFLQLFFYIQGAIKSAEDFGLMAASLGEYLRQNNIVYAEIFFAPSKFLQNGFNFSEMIKVLVDRIRKIKKEDGIDIRILVDVSRSFGPENAMKNLNFVLQTKEEEVIGIGLGGPEKVGPARDYTEVFKAAREAGLRTVAHAGEDDGPWSIWDTVQLLKAERIGHGTSAIQDPKLVQYLKENKIPIEICLTSNIFTGKYVNKEQNHPVRYYFDQGLITSINTDDPEIFNVTLSYEYFKLYRFLDFNVSEIVELIKSGVYASFHKDKDKLWESMHEKIIKLLRANNFKYN